ncbi:YlxQ-related RNA-binding protein [Ligilactobacillus salitolerans]|nr:YlxQ-related RNA-binding protein [Ligilactobacillus salitolerans]
MENRQKVLNLLGLAQRARKLTAGSDMVLKQIRAQKAVLVFVANDSAANTRKKFSDKCRSYNVSLSQELSALELSSAIGQKRSVVAVTDKGFGRKLLELLST